MSSSEVGKLGYILGLTGSIGMGKSTTAKMFVSRGISVQDSDAIVHRLYGADGLAAKVIGKRFPTALRQDGSVNRRILNELISDDPGVLSILEKIVHPLVTKERRIFLDDKKDEDLVVLDIPLLFETGAEDVCDGVLVVTASRDIQRQRVLARPGMNEETFERILRKQMSDSDKRERADFVIDTSLGLKHVRNAVTDLIAGLKRSRR